MCTDLPSHFYHFALQETFNIDASRKRFVLLIASKAIRNFRNTLTTEYMRDGSGNIIEQPPSKFAHLIKQEDWDAFIGRRQHESFQVFLLYTV